MSNRARLYIARWNSAVEKYDTDRQRCILEIIELLLDEALPSIFRLKGHLLIAAQSDEDGGSWYATKVSEYQ